MEDVENDLELQNELKMLGWSDDEHPSSSKAKIKPKINIDEKSVSSNAYQTEANELLVEFASNDSEFVGDDTVDFTDEDMSDPYLLSQLKYLNSGLLEESDYFAKKSYFKTDSESNSSPSKDKSMSKTAIGVAAIKPNIAIAASIDTISADDAKARALSFHKDGNKAEALKWLKLSKSIDERALNTGTDLSNSNRLHREPLVVANAGAASDATTMKKKMHQGTQQSQGSSPYIDRFSHLENALNSAMRENLKDAQVLLTSDRRSSANKLRDYKRYQEDLNVLASRRDLPGAEPAPFVWKNIEKEIVVERFDIGDDQLVLTIEGIFDLEASLDGYSSRTIQLSYDLGVPRDAPATGKIVGKVDTRGQVSLNFQSILPIIKRNRSMQTLFSKKKATFEISLIRGMFYSNVLLGTASISLAQLNSKCECGGVLPIEKFVGNTSTGKKLSSCSAGSVTAHLRLRKPIAGAEIIKTTERVLVLEAWPSVSHVYRTTTENISAPSAKLTLAEKLPQDTTANAVKGSSSVSSASKPHGEVIMMSDREQLDPCAVDFLVSNDVLEAEIAADTAAIVKIVGKIGTRSEEEESALFALKIRLQLMSTKLQMLVSSVQEEKLSFEEYLACVADRLCRDRILLKWVIAASRAEEPPEDSVLHRSALARRINIMEGEIALARESML